MEIFTNSSVQAFVKDKTVEFQAMPCLTRHQIDIGLATAGTISIFPDAGTGYKPVAAVIIDVTTHKLPVQVEGLFKKIKLVPAGISNDGYTVSYAGGAIS